MGGCTDAVADLAAPPGGPIRVAVVNSLVARNDAISASVADTYAILGSHPDFAPTVLTYKNDLEGLPAEIVPSLADLLVHPAFLEADVIIWHFGIFYELFDAVLVGNGHARQVVWFHNVTPKEFLPEKSWPTIERSLRQCHHLAYADEVWSGSPTNATFARDLGVPTARMRTIPLSVSDMPLASIGRKPGGAANVLYLGRFVHSKGVLDLVRAAALVRDRAVASFRLTLAGNVEFSDPDYVRQVREAIVAYGLEGIVEFKGTVDDAHLAALYRDAHILAIPSYHEGFCKPVIEGLRAGCVPVGYAAYNLPVVANRLGRMVPPGDVGALAGALEDVACALEGATDLPLEAVLPLDRGPTSLALFDRLVTTYVQEFMPMTIAEQVQARVRELHWSADPRGPGLRATAMMDKILVVPDNEMRARDRPSLNRLPDLGDWEPGNVLTDVMRELHTPVCIHRKPWEYAICIQGLRNLGAIHPEAQALAVGAGFETPLFYFANTIRRMVATDLYDNPAHEGTPAMLTSPESFSPFPIRREHLEVLRMSGDDLRFDDETFDFTFCLSSIEHFGSRATQRKALNEMARVTRRGGIVCIVTELILTGHSDSQYYRWDEIESMYLRHPRLRLVGGSPDLSISESLIRYPVDPEASKGVTRSPHIVLDRGGMLWTSFSMFLERTG